MEEDGDGRDATHDQEEEGYEREDIGESLIDSVGLRISVGGGRSLVGVLVSNVVELGH